MTENWEDLLEDSEEEKPEEAAQSKPVEEPARKKEADAGYVELVDPIAEKLRRQRIVEKADAELMEDLFSGCPKPEATAAAAAEEIEAKAKPTTAMTNLSADPLDMIDLKTLKDVESFTTRLCGKIAASPAKSPAWLRLLDLLLKECVPKMDPKDVMTLQNKTKQALKQKQDAKRESAAGKKKPNAIGSQIRDFKDEMELFYGENADEEEEKSEKDDDYYADFI
eukprot:GHVS01020848.1.p1 GENE.GHVS01020848.1~~GHVS01020848.1.p1  ORF type:complete len:224 (+),score=66.57 GHVS01020848.1:122-793(+)